MLGVKSSRCGRDGRRADLGLARAAFRHDQPHFVALELPLDRLRHRELGVVEGIARVVMDVLIDCQHFRGKRLLGGIEQRNKKIFDPLGHRNAEGVQIVRYRLQFVQRGGAGDRARYGDGSAFQAAFRQYFAEIGISVRDWEGLFREMNQEGNNAAFLRTTEEGEVIGFLQFQPIAFTSWFFEETCGFIREFWVAPAFRRRGYGSLLL